MKKKYCFGVLFVAVLSSSIAFAEGSVPSAKDSPVKIKNLPGEVGKYFVVKMTPTEKRSRAIQLDFFLPFTGPSTIYY